MSLSDRNRRLFLLGFFKQETDTNETLELNGFVLFKHWNGAIKQWTVDIFTPESYENMKNTCKTPIQKETLF